MQPESLTRVLAGSLVLLGVVLTALVSRWWVLLAAFAGANLVVSALTGFCPRTLLLTKIGWLNPSASLRRGGRR
jgi:hypothetical protein